MRPQPFASHVSQIRRNFPSIRCLPKFRPKRRAHGAVRERYSLPLRAGALVHRDPKNRGIRVFLESINFNQIDLLWMAAEEIYRKPSSTVGLRLQEGEEEEEEGRRREAKSFGPWDQDDQEIEDDGNIYASFTGDVDFRHHCRKTSVIQLFEHPGPDGGFVYMEGEYLDLMDSDPGGSYHHDLARDVISRYNSEQEGNLELIKIHKVNYLGMFAFMKIEARDNTTGRVHPYQLAVWDKECDGHPVVGRFKDVTLESTVTLDSQN